MALVLFRTGDLVKWLVLGFAAWLAGLTGGNHGFQLHFPMPPLGDWGGEVTTTGSGFSRGGWLIEPAKALLGSVAVLWVVGALLALIVLLTWLSSRGRFIFLDGLVRNRAEIVEPWRRLGRVADSLFVWRLVLGAAFLALAAVGLGAVLWPAYIGGEVGLLASWMVAVPLGLLGMMLGLTAVYAFVFLDHFVLPLMYRFELSGREAWSRFLTLFRAYPGWLLLYGPVLLVLKIAAGLAVFAVIVLTCCLAGCLLMIPYLGAVLLLPVLAFFRLFGLEFLMRLDPAVDPYPRED